MLSYLILVLKGCFVAQCCVSSFGVVEGFDVLEDGGGGLFVIGVDGIACPFAFQAAEEAFHAGVVPAVSFAAHARHHFVLRQQLLVRCTCVLAPAIRVVDL